MSDEPEIEWRDVFGYQLAVSGLGRCELTGMVRPSVLGNMVCVFWSPPDADPQLYASVVVAEGRYATQERARDAATTVMLSALQEGPPAEWPLRTSEEI